MKLPFSGVLGLKMEKAGGKQGYMGPQPFLCVLQMRKGRLIKRSGGRRQAERPEGFVPLC